MRAWQPSRRCGLLALVLALGLSACEPTVAQDPRPRPGPTEQETAAAYHPAYKALDGSRSECLGRIVFEVPAAAAFEWGLPKNALTNKEILGFSRILRDQDAINLANVAVVVAAQATNKTILEMQDSVQTDKNIALQDFDESIQTKTRIAKSRTEALKTPELKADRQQFADYEKDLRERQEELAGYKQRRQNLEKDWYPTSWGLPDSTGYIAGPTLYAFILRGGFAFQFMSTGGEGEAEFEQRLAAFKDFLSRFEYRPLYQVPAKSGLCIPHGFINDDGKGHIRAQVSYRFADSPGVIYNLATAIEGVRNFEPNEPLLEATARSTVAGLVGNTNGRKLKAIGPKTIAMGGRSGALGGIYTIEGMQGYSLYAGSRGFDRSQVLPFISLDMRSFDRETAPEDLKVDPPPYVQSMQRFEQTLGSLRLRKAP